ncbi:ATP-dependent helicase [bacterium]|nr:ATP-dependent helicase [bacterium]
MVRILSDERIVSYCDWLEEISRDNGSEDSLKVLNLRNLLESFYEEISSEFKESFPNLYSRFTYANEYYNFDNDLQANLNGIRILYNKVVHGEIKNISSKSLKSSIYYLYLLVCQFTERRISSLEADFADIEIEQFTKIQKSPHTPVSHLSLIVDRWDLIQQNDGSFKSEIVGYEKDGDEEIKVLVWDLKDSENPKDNFVYGKKIGSIAKLLWQCCNLIFYHIKQNSNDERVYFTQSNTKIVLEADFLLDATTIAKCFQNNSAYHKIAVISLFDKAGISIPMVTGNFVNQMLDRMISGNHRDFNTTFKECVHSSVLTSLSLGTGNLVDIMENIKQNHYSNLQNLCEKIKDIRVTTEPTFYSPQYGLFGRLDGLLEGETDDSNRRSIFELKSGSVPKFGVWINHAIQVHIYDMLLSSLYGEGRTGSSMIFYSQDKQGELRNIAPAPFMEQHILMVRNCIVSEFKALAEGSLDIIKYFKEIDLKRIPKFSLERFQVIQAAIANLSLEEKSYFSNYLSFLFREIWATKTGAYTKKTGVNSGKSGFSSLWTSSLIEKEDNPRVLTNLKFAGYEDNLLLFNRPKEIKTLSLREGDRVILYLYADKILSQVLKCSLNYIDSNQIALSPRNAEINKSLFLNEDNWIIQADTGDANLFGLMTSLSEFVVSAEANRQLLLGKVRPRFDPKFQYQDADEYLNPIIQKALSSQDYFLLQGPPGTGKTSSFLLRCISYLNNKSSEKVLVLAFTNRAIDEVCLKLNQAELKYLRLGSSSSDSISSLNNLCHEAEKLQEISQRISTYRIFCSTVASYHANREALHNIISFDTLFIDEASQLIEPELIGITKNFQRFILIGDQNQLPAISIQSDNNQGCQDQLLNNLNIHSFRQSLFERLFANAQTKGWKHAYHTLTHHYRMHQEIADLINLNYDNQLMTKIERQTNAHFFENYTPSNNNLVKNILAKNRCIFIDIPDKTSSKISHLEAIVVKKLLQAILTSYQESLTSNTVGVICNWRSQINLIKEITQDLLSGKDVTIDTVERYQGSERDIIIYSLTVNYHHQLELLQSLTPNRRVDRKLNVALSRSREQIIVIGNASVLSSLPQYAMLIDQIKRSFLYIGFNQASKEFFNQREN